MKLEQQDLPKKPDYWLFSPDTALVILIIAVLLMHFIVGVAVGSQSSWSVIEPYFRLYFISIMIVLGIYAIAFHFYLSYKRGI